MSTDGRITCISCGQTFYGSLTPEGLCPLCGGKATRNKSRHGEEDGIYEFKKSVDCAFCGQRDATTIATCSFGPPSGFILKSYRITNLLCCEPCFQRVKRARTIELCILLSVFPIGLLMWLLAFPSKDERDTPYIIIAGLLMAVAISVRIVRPLVKFVLRGVYAPYCDWTQRYSEGQALGDMDGNVRKAAAEALRRLEGARQGDRGGSGSKPAS